MKNPVLGATTAPIKIRVIAEHQGVSKSAANVEAACNLNLSIDEGEFLSF